MMTSRSRSLKKCEIVDLMREAKVNDMAVIVHPSGELEIFPAIHRQRRASRLDAPELSPADKALAKWMAENGGDNQNARRA